MTRRALFYVQHLLGIGHLARASLVARGLKAKGFDTTLVMGGMPVDGFPGDGIKTVQLPPLKAGVTKFNELTGADGKIADQAYLDRRRDELLSVFRQTRPGIVIIEAFPFARRQMRFELLPLLDAAKAADWRPLIAASVRDIIQKKTRPGRLEETVSTVQRYFDAVLVHGDPQFARFEDTFEGARSIEDLIHYTGIVAGTVPQLSGPAFDVVVSAGGGAAGELIMRSALAARPLTNLANASWCILTGPNLPASTAASLEAGQPKNVFFDVRRPDFRALLAHARLSISQAGYNTCADILQAGCPALLVPFAQGGEMEQTFRASRLQQLDLATSIAETAITPQSLARVIDAAARRNRLARPPLDLDGAGKTAKILENLLSAAR